MRAIQPKRSPRDVIRVYRLPVAEDVGQRAVDGAQTLVQRLTSLRHPTSDLVVDRSELVLHQFDLPVDPFRVSGYRSVDRPARVPVGLCRRRVRAEFRLASPETDRMRENNNYYRFRHVERNASSITDLLRQTLNDRDRLVPVRQASHRANVRFDYGSGIVFVPLYD